MKPGGLTHGLISLLDHIPGRRAAHSLPPHLQTGRRGEQAAYFYLRQQGYVIVARDYRSPLHRGDIDLIGWHDQMLRFIEVKTRTSRGVASAEAAVDHAKQRQLHSLAQDFLRHLASPCQWRFDVLSVYYLENNHSPQFDLFQNAFPGEQTRY